MAFKAGEAQGQEAVGGWELVWGGFLPGNHEAAASSQLLENPLVQASSHP